MKSLASAFWLFLLLSSPTFAAMSVLNAGANAPVTPPGSCPPGQTLNLLYRGTTTATGLDSPTLGVFRAAPFEGSGRGYAISSDLGISRTRLTNFDLSGVLPVQGSNVIINATSNTPDSASTIRAVLYDGNLYAFGFQNTGACAGVACLHIRQYTGLATTLDVTGLVPVASGFTVLIRDVGTDTYWSSFTHSSGGSSIVKLTSGLNVVAALPTTTNTAADLTSDGTYLYSVYINGGIVNVLKVNLVDLTSTNFTIPGAPAANAIVYSNGHLYVGLTRLGVPRIDRLDPVTGANTGTIALTAGEGALSGGLAVDPFNTRLYVVSGDGAGTGRVRRINTNTFTLEETEANAFPPQAQGIGFDFANQHIYYATVLASVYQVTKVDLCS